MGSLYVHWHFLWGRRHIFFWKHYLFTETPQNYRWFRKYKTRKWYSLFPESMERLRKRKKDSENIKIFFRKISCKFRKSGLRFRKYHLDSGKVHTYSGNINKIQIIHISFPENLFLIQEKCVAFQEILFPFQENHEGFRKKGHVSVPDFLKTVVCEIPLGPLYWSPVDDSAPCHRCPALCNCYGIEGIRIIINQAGQYSFPI